MTDFALYLGLLGVLILPSTDWKRCRPRFLESLYTPREWQILARLLAVLGLSWVLLYADLCQGIPGALFLYGRF